MEQLERDRMKEEKVKKKQEKKAEKKNKFKEKFGKIEKAIGEKLDKKKRKKSEEEAEEDKEADNDSGSANPLGDSTLSENKRKYKFGDIAKKIQKKAKEEMHKFKEKEEEKKRKKKEKIMRKSGLLESHAEIDYEVVNFEEDQKEVGQYGTLDIPEVEDVQMRQTIQEQSDHFEAMQVQSQKKKKFTIANLKKAREKIKMKVIKASKNKNAAITVIGQEESLNPQDPEFNNPYIRGTMSSGWTPNDFSDQVEPVETPQRQEPEEAKFSAQVPLDYKPSINKESSDEEEAKFSTQLEANPYLEKHLASVHKIQQAPVQAEAAPKKSKQMLELE